MATIEKHQNKSGITYRITVSCGCDSSGKRIRRRTTFRPPPGMTPKQALEWVESDMLPYYPIGVYKDRSAAKEEK